MKEVPSADINSFIKYLIKYCIERFSNIKLNNHLIATIWIQLLALSHGVCMGWLSPNIQLLSSPNTPLTIPISVHQVSWIASLYALGALVGIIIYDYLTVIFGNKHSLHFIIHLPVLHWILIFFTQDIRLIYVARFLAGTSSCIFIFIYKFMCDLVDKKHYGALSALTLLSTNIGMLLGYILCSHMEFYQIPGMAIILPLMHSLSMHFLPETPKSLIEKGQLEKAEQAYTFYHHTKNDEAAKISDNFQRFKEQIQNEPTFLINKQNALKDIFEFENLRIFFITFLLTLPIAGSFVLTNYSSYIFANLGFKSAISPNTCTILVGIAQTLGTLVYQCLCGVVSRKSLYLISTLCLTFAMIAMGVFYQFNDTDGLSEYYWLPLILFMFIVFTANNGIFTLIFDITADIMPPKIYHIGTRLTITLMSLIIFLSLKIFPVLIQKIGLYETFYTAVLVCLPCLVYLYIFLPQINRKSQHILKT